MNKYDFVIRYLKEMSLNYKNQYPKEIPDMDLVVDIIVKEFKK